MTGRIPTTIGDVLILRTSQSFHIHAVGAVHHDGQQDFRAEESAQQRSGHGAALAAAKTILKPGRKIFLLDIDTGEWRVVSD